MACAPGNDSLGRSFSATSRPNRASFARYTSPIPPAPSGATISYGPSFVPAFSTIEIVRPANNPHIASVGAQHAVPGEGAWQIPRIRYSPFSAQQFTPKQILIAWATAGTACCAPTTATAIQHHNLVRPEFCSRCQRHCGFSSACQLVTSISESCFCSSKGTRSSTRFPSLVTTVYLPGGINCPPK